MDALFAKMEEGDQAEWEIRARLEEIIGEDSLLGMGYDFYDASLEIYIMDWSGRGSHEELPTNSATFQLGRGQVEAIFERTGCHQFWVNFKDGSEQFCRRSFERDGGEIVPLLVGDRTPKPNNDRFERYNHGRNELHKLKVKLAHLQRDLDALRARPDPSMLLVGNCAALNDGSGKFEWHAYDGTGWRPMIAP